MPAVGRASKPKSLVEHLSDLAPKRPINESVSITRYLISARLLLNQATQYRVIGDEEQLYVILLRFASLVVETIPKHRDFNSNNPTYVGLKRELLDKYLPELERLKTSLQLKHRPEPPAAVSRNRPADAVQLSASPLPQLDWASSGAPIPTPTPTTPLPAAAAADAGPAGWALGEGPPSLQVDDLLELMQGAPVAAPSSSAGQLAQPASRGDAAVGAGAPMATLTAYSGPADPYVLAAAANASMALAVNAVGVPGVPPPKYSHSYASSGSRHALFGSSPGGRGGEVQRPAQVGASLPRYPALDVVPAVAATAATPDLTQLTLAPGMEQLQAMAVLPHPSAGPSLGPQEVEVHHMPASTNGLPDTCTVPHTNSSPPLPPPPPESAIVAAPAQQGGPKELVKRAQLRDIHVSVALMEEFLHYARSNTARGIESCGILAGKLLAGDSTFAITTLIIPKQQGTTDTVQALNEEEIFEAQFERELYPLGWIHTHPSQTCFLSSIDVHTQCGYQTMLDEAVAIVMAPTDASKRCGIFRLSTPGGLSLVQKCTNRGFHMHPPTDTGQELYELCGHVYLNPRTKHEVLDLR